MHTLSEFRDDFSSTKAKLSFLRPLEKYKIEDPYYISCNVPPEREDERTNLEFQPQIVKAFDIYGHELQTDLERHHFEYLEHKSKISFSPESECEQTEEIQRYLKETIDLVKNKLNAELCVAYSYVVRGRISSWQALPWLQGQQPD